LTALTMEQKEALAQKEALLQEREAALHQITHNSSVHQAELASLILNIKEKEQFLAEKDVLLDRHKKLLDDQQRIVAELRQEREQQEAAKLAQAQEQAILEAAERKRKLAADAEDKRKEALAKADAQAGALRSTMALRKTLAEKETLLTERASIIAAKDEEIMRQKLVIQEQEKLALEAKQRVELEMKLRELEVVARAEREAESKRLELLASKDAELVALNSLLAEKEALLAEQSALLTERETEMSIQRLELIKKQRSDEARYRLDEANAFAQRAHGLSEHNLEVVIKSASGLAAKDSSGTSDPYVVVSLKDREEHKTKTVYETLDPVWNEAFGFTAVDLQPEDILVFNLNDFDRFASDDPLGTCKLSLWQIVMHPSQEWKLDVQGPDVSGTLLVYIHLAPAIASKFKERATTLALEAKARQDAIEEQKRVEKESLENLENLYSLALIAKDDELRVRSCIIDELRAELAKKK